MAIYIPTFLYPMNKTLDMTQIQNFTCQINGTSCTHYQLIIKKVSDNTTVYDSTKLALSPAKYDKETLIIVIPANTLTNGLDYKYTITVYENSNSASTGEILFHAYTTPTNTLTVPGTITTQSNTFTSTYSQAQNVGIKQFKYILYDANNIVLKDSGYIYSAKLTYTFDGFLNGNTYKVESIITNQYDISVSSGKKIFTVSYSKPSIFVVPVANLLEDLSAVQVVWGQAVQLAGTVSGTSTYVNDFVRTNNKALQINSGSYSEYVIDIPLDFNLKFKIKFSTGFTGIFCDLFGDAEYQIGYNGTQFYCNNKGIIIYGKPTTLPTNPIYVDIRPTDILIDGVRIGM